MNGRLKACILALLAVLWVAPALAQMSPILGFPPGTFQNRAALYAPAAGGGGTSYVTGDRTASITVTESGGLLSGSLTNFVDGTPAGTGMFFNGTTLTGAEWIKFDFGTAKIVDEAKWYQSDSNGQGNWKWQGSNDNSSWADIGSTFALHGVASPSTITALNGNVTAYRYYRLLGMSSGTNGTPWVYEIEFKQN